MSAWQRVLDSVVADFSDLADPARSAQLVLRLAVAALLGGFLGYERAHAGKAAGMRTHMLVAVGCALFILVPHHVGMSDDGISRVLQGLTAGIGFLGAGAILKVGQRGEVHGLTTAAGIWLTAAIGVAVGMGRIVSAMLATLLAWVILHVVTRIEARLTPHGNHDESPQKEEK